MNSSLNKRWFYLVVLGLKRLWVVSLRRRYTNILTMSVNHRVINIIVGLTLLIELICSYAQNVSKIAAYQNLHIVLNKYYTTLSFCSDAIKLIV